MAIHHRELRVRIWSSAVFVCLLALGTDGYAQHHAGHFHSPGFGGVSDNFGGVQHGAGAFQTTGPATFGGPGLVQQFGGGFNDYGGYNNYAPYNYGGFNSSVGFNSRYPIGDRSLGGTYSSPNYTYGTFNSPFFGVSRGYGALNYSRGYISPVIWSTPFYSYSPSVFGYGTGVFSPNFPSGNYISNGYIGVVPGGFYAPYCQTGWPYITGLSPYSPAAIIAPSILNLNVNMRPVFRSTASYSLTDPRLIDLLAPAPNPGGIAAPPAPQFQDQNQAPLLADEPALHVPKDSVPVLNEFEAVPRDQMVSALAEKIQSLRYQSSGDDAFQKADYATADVFYATAIKTAPDRRAPYLRMAIVRIALRDFPQAARYLKTGLAMESDASRPWVTGEELYGSKVAERARSHGGPLWNWLAERPLSADRLLLAGTFQKLRGFDKTADQMLGLARHEGLEAALVSQVAQLATNDIGPRSVSDDLNQMIEQESIRRTSSVSPELQSAERRSVEQSGGIFLRGSDVATRKSNTAESLPLVPAPPEPAFPEPDQETETAPVPLEIPVPK